MSGGYRMGNCIHASPRRIDTGLQLCGRFDILQYRHGKLLYSSSQKNLVVQSGENLAVRRFNYTDAVAAPQWIAFGTDATAADKAQLALLAEIPASRFGAVSGLSLGTTLRLGFSVAVPAVWANVSEVGIFNAVAAGIMISRSVIPPFAASVGDTIGVFWFLEFLGAE